MLIHPWDGAISDAEWRDRLAGHDFGQLAVTLIARTFSGVPCHDPCHGPPQIV
jgi:hypothetical protein